jgi:hypothetical protein
VGSPWGKPWGIHLGGRLGDPPRYATGDSLLGNPERDPLPDLLGYPLGDLLGNSSPAHPQGVPWGSPGILPQGAPVLTGSEGNAPGGRSNGGAPPHPLKIMLGGFLGPSWVDSGCILIRFG